MNDFDEYVGQCIAHYRAAFRQMANGSKWHLFRAISGHTVIVAMDNPNAEKYVLGVENLHCKTELRLIEILHDTAKKWPIYEDSTQ